MSQHASLDQLGCVFYDEQFRRAIKDGAIAIIDDSLKQSILEAYRVVGRANELIRGAMVSVFPDRIDAKNDALQGIQQTGSLVARARDSLLEFLRSDT